MVCVNNSRFLQHGSDDKPYLDGLVNTHAYYLIIPLVDSDGSDTGSMALQHRDVLTTEWIPQHHLQGRVGRLCARAIIRTAFNTHNVTDTSALLMEDLPTICLWRSIV